MATVAQVAKASLQRILVQASESSLEPDEYQDFIFAMNNYMSQLDAQGVSLGYTEVENLSDEVTIPAGALRGLIANMAQQGLQTMKLLGQRIGKTALPSTLPIGSGNEDQQWGISGAFYPETEQDILAETTGAIGLENNTNG